MGDENAAESLSTSTDTPTDEGKETPQEPKLAWIVKESGWYKDELRDCRSISARFNQYFVAGEFTDCSSWKKDFENLKKWEQSKDVDALNEVIESEKARVRQRLQGHYNNDVWEQRKVPLSKQEWSPPLPDNITKGYDNSFLKEKADKIKSGEESLGDVDENIREGGPLSESSSCSIV